MTQCELNELFQSAKERLDIKEVAKSYGLQIGRAGKALCPFHSEKTPSLSFKGQGFKCFGCGVGGDVFRLAGGLLGIDKPIEVLRQLNSDFGLGLELDRKQSPAEVARAKAKQQEIQHQKNTRRAFDEWVHNAFLVCTKYVRLLREWRLEYAPKSEGEELHPLFEESLLQLTRTEYLCDVLTYGEQEDWEQFYIYCREEVKAIEQRLHGYYRELAG